MTTMDMLTEVFRQVFDDDGIVISRETTANDIEEWDSLSHVNLIVAVEARFKVKFALRELQTLKNVGELIDLVDSKLPR